MQSRGDVIVRCMHACMYAWMDQWMDGWVNIDIHGFFLRHLNVIP